MTINFRMIKERQNLELPFFTLMDLCSKSSLTSVDTIIARKKKAKKKKKELSDS